MHIYLYTYVYIYTQSRFKDSGDPRQKKTTVNITLSPPQSLGLRLGVLH